MEIKNLFEPVIKQDILDRLNKLTPETKAAWGKMNVAQMMAHCQMPMGVGLGVHKIPRSFVGRLFGSLIKPIIYNDKPFKKSLPTDKSFIMADPKDFAKEKEKLSSMIREFKEENITDSPHPLFGKLTKEQWSKATWKHLDHHLRQFGV